MRNAGWRSLRTRTILKARIGAGENSVLAAYVASGPNKGKRKRVGITSSGTRARKGTIAADTKYYPYGTVMIIPGYGKGVVEDIGGAIKGPNRLDVFLIPASGP